MTNIQLNAGELWELGGERHYFEQVMGSGFLHFRSERSGAPFQIPLDNGEAVSPTVDWLKEQFAIGAVRRLDATVAKTAAQQIALAREDDFDSIMEKDPRAFVRQIVLTSLDRIPAYSRSDEGIRRALASIWAAKPRQLGEHRPPSPTTVRRWLKERGCVDARSLKAMVSMSGRVPRAKRLPTFVHRRLHRAAMTYWSSAAVTVRGAFDFLKWRLVKVNRGLKARRLPTVPLPSAETFRKHVRFTECFDTVAAKFGVKEANQRFKACGRGLAAHRPQLLGAMDHTRADFFVVVDVGGLRMLGRPWLTVLIDVHSRCVVGWVLSFEPPSLYSITECIKRANRPKLQMLGGVAANALLVDIYGKFDETVHGKFHAEGLSAEIDNVGVDLAVHEERTFIHALVGQCSAGLPTGVHARDLMSPTGDDCTDRRSGFGKHEGRRRRQAFPAQWLLAFADGLEQRVVKRGSSLRRGRAVASMEMIHRDLLRFRCG